MSLLEKITNDMKLAMKARDQLKVSTLRMLMSQIKNARINAKEDLNPEQELAVIINAAKKHKESIEIYQKTARTDLLEKEQKELAIIEEYLPEQISDEEVEKTITEIIEQTAAKSMKDIGKVMSEAMKILKGKADGKKIQQLVRSKLA